MPQLAVEFRGMCLFGLSGDGKRLHVLLPQVIGMEHRSVEQYKDGTGDWITTEFQPGTEFEYGIKGQPITDMPDPEDLSSITGMPNGRRIREAEMKGDPKGPRGSHLLLHGGTLAVASKIGVWQVEGDTTGTEYNFPLLLRWEGIVDTGQPTGLRKIWNAMPEETPDPGRNSPDPKSDIGAGEAHCRAASHFKSYFAILNEKANWINFQREKLPKKFNAGGKYLETLVVASCPSGFVDVD